MTVFQQNKAVAGSLNVSSLHRHAGIRNRIEIGVCFEV